MFNKFYRKGVSLLEALIAMFLLGMITMIYFNSTTTFIDSQQTLIKFDRKEQVAELILQGVMEYTKQNATLYGTIESDGEQTMNGTTDTINVTIDQPGILPANMVLPKVGDIFVISGIKGRYTISSVTGNVNARIKTTKPISAGTVQDNASIVVIGFKKDNLECFDGLNLKNTAPSSLSDCAIVPDNVKAFHNHWRQVIIDEVGDLSTASIEITDGNLVKVTLDDIVLAKKISTCLFAANATTAKFAFPGKTDPVVSGIMSGLQSPVQHYSFVGKQETYTNPSDDHGDPVSNQSDNCSTVNASTCRQSYATLDTATVFLYRYTGTTTQHWKPSGCNGALGWQCPAVTVEPNDLSLWFIFDEANNNDSWDSSQLGGIIPGNNRRGFFHFRASSLPLGARILIFDDSSESCQNNITNNACTGRYKWGGAHDGMVIHLNTSDLSSLADIGLEILGTTYGIDKWRVLKSDIASCLIASGEPGSSHGVWNNREENQSPPSLCWEEITVNTTTLASTINATDTTITLTDSSAFPLSGSIQIGQEKIQYASNNKSTGVLSGVTRGVRPIGTLTGCDLASDGITCLPVITASESAGAIGSITSNQNLDLGFYGGYAQVGPDSNFEILRIDYSNNYGSYDNNQMKVLARAQGGTTQLEHLNGTPISNFDMRARGHAAGTIVYEGDGTSVAAVMPTNDNHTMFNRTRMKSRINLKLSESSVCQ